MNQFELEKLNQTAPNFSNSQCLFFAENCIVALENHNHKPGCKISISGDSANLTDIIWSTQVKKSGYQEEKKIIEHAAETIAFFVTTEITDYKIIEEAIIGTGVDYWVGYDKTHKNYDPKNFLNARLEISGINVESATNTVENRVKQKKIQTNQSSSSTLPAYISVTEFATPKTHFCKK